MGRNVTVLIRSKDSEPWVEWRKITVVPAPESLSDWLKGFLEDLVENVKDGQYKAFVTQPSDVVTVKTLRSRVIELEE